jgi:5'-nucleotidase
VRRTRSIPVAGVVAAALVIATPLVAAAAPPNDVTVQLLAMNDFHGRISDTTGRDSELTDPGPDGAYGTPDDVVLSVGGSANVATTVHRMQAAFDESTQGPHDSFFVGAGDLISASTFESSIFKDEPTIEVLNAIGLDASAVGNHEFDRGTGELRRISAATDGEYTDDVTACEGVTPGVDGCFGEGEHVFSGADFPYLAANVVSKETGEPMLPPYQVFQTPAHTRVALIGVVTETTPTIVTPAGIQDVTFLDEADAVNKWVPELQAQGVQAIGVLVHEGGSNAGADRANPNGCASLTGPIVDINDRIDDAVDLIVSAHSHQAYNCLLPVPGGHPRLVTQAGFYGRLVTDIRLTLDRTTGDVDRAATYRATNVPVTREAPDPEIERIVAYWNGRAAEAGDRVVGSVTADMPRAGSDESALGTFVADAQLAGVQGAAFGNPVVAFMNPGGLRADLAGGEVTFRELFAVQPFGNTVNATTLTGAQLKQVLEQQFDNPAAGQARILSTSDGFRYEYDPARPAGDRVFACSISIGGAPVVPDRTYRVAGNSFLLGGGDNFTTFSGGTQPVTGPVDVDTSAAYLGANPTVTPPPGDHAVQVTAPSC